MEQAVDNRSTESSQGDEEYDDFEQEGEEQEDDDVDDVNAENVGRVLGFFDPMGMWGGGGGGKNVTMPMARSRAQRHGDDDDARGLVRHQDAQKTESGGQEGTHVVVRAGSSSHMHTDDGDDQPRAQARDRDPAVHARAALLAASSERGSGHTHTQSSTKGDRNKTGTRSADTETTQRASKNTAEDAPKHVVRTQPDDALPRNEYEFLHSENMHAANETEELSAGETYSISNLRKLRTQETEMKMSKILNMIHLFHDRVDAALDEGAGKLEVCRISVCVM